MYRHHPVFYPVMVFYPILVFLLMDGSFADRSTSCKEFSNPEAETTVFRDNGCFLLSRVERTWNESKTFCEDLGDGWSLVVIVDAEVQKHVDNLTVGVSLESWIGLRRRQYDGYRWVSGDRLSFQFPDFFKELGEGEVHTLGNCVTTSPPDEGFNYGTWNARKCTTKFFTICHTNAATASRKKTTTTTTSTTITPAKEDTSAGIVVPVSTGAAVVAAVAVVGVVVILCRRKKAKRRRARPIDAHGDEYHMYLEVLE